MNSAPGVRHQLWMEISVLASVLFLVISYLLLKLTWCWFEEPEWGYFHDHLEYLVSGLGNFVPLISIDDWNQYRNYLESQNLEMNFAIHFFGPLVMALVMSLLIVRTTLWVPGGRVREIHISGPKLYEGNKAFNLAKSCHKNDLRKNKLSKDGVFLHPKIRIGTAREQMNLLAIGAAGSGKSMFFKPLVSQVIKRGDCALIFDEKGEYTQEFYSSESAVLIAPWDHRSDVWNICLDVRNQQEAQLLASCLIVESSDKDPMWINGARLLFTGMIVSLLASRKVWGWKQLYGLLCMPQDQVIDLLNEHFPIASSLIQKESKTTQGFYVSLISGLSWIQSLATAWPVPRKSGFSLRRWVRKRSAHKVLIIQNHPEFESLGAPLCNAMISLMNRFYLAQEDGYENPVWLLIDEFANLPKNLEVLKWMELGRSRGARTILCTQSISQVRKIYGDKATDAILNLLSMAVCLRLGGGGSDAKEASQLLSHRTVQRPNTTKENISWSQVEELLVPAYALTNLQIASSDGVNGYMFIPGWDACFKLCWPPYRANKIAKGRVRAKWLTPNFRRDTSQNKLRRG